ncbi:hypothetical protein [Streptomyces canus]|uniref:hypothetical protein n=1 Tax=Streptomyces canus TaxID=58343 RepID=UPI003862F973|nr:hypothetical protein OH824_28905 [Streptomyces canus]
MTATYLTAHAGPGVDKRLLQAEATVHGFNVATWWAFGALLPAALIAGVVVNAERAPTPPGCGGADARAGGLAGLRPYLM